MSSLFQPSFPKSESDHIRWGNLAGSSMALAIANAAKNHNGLTLLIVKDTPTALKLEHELNYFASGQLEVLTFPDWETLPYDTFSPHQDIISQRLRTLYQLSSMKRGVVIVPINTLLLRTPPKAYLDSHSLVLVKGQTLEFHQLRQKLENAGYIAVDQVMEHGEFSARGSILDLYPMGSEEPLRVDFFDDEIDSLKWFDPESQRSQSEIEKIELLPAREFPTDENGIEIFRSNWREQFDPSNQKDSIYYQVSKGIMPAGIEYYLPLFFPAVESLFDYLADNTLIIQYGDLMAASDYFWADINSRYEDRRYDIQRPIISPSQLYLNIDELFGKFKSFGRISVSAEAQQDKPGRYNFLTQKLDDIAVNHQLKEPLTKLKQFIQDWQKSTGKLLFSVESQGRRESLLELLKPLHLNIKEFATLDDFLVSHETIGITIGAAEYSFVIEESDARLAFITETELLGHKVTQRRRRDKQQATDENAIIRNLAELQIGQPVVHLDHGVGRYLGMVTMDVGGNEAEYLTLEYAKEAKLYVPVSSLHLISRYSGGDAEHAPMHNLGSEAWSKAKKKAAEKARDVAAELLDIYAQRSAKPGHAFEINKDEYRQFAEGFPFEETADQQNAIAAVLNDMRMANAMDRLVCGDVGFGKTEVAMRAAYAAVANQKQVAVLVPTTLLAQQHFENFKDRFADWPVKVELMSRFRTAKEQKAAIAGIESGNVDIIVGTHKLLSDDIKYADLGLLIIDEEHRFGVRQKEKLKSIRADVDILTLTATPIPRTLNMSLSGIRDLSIIATPPAKRLSIKTFVRQSDDAVTREAIMREIMRGGQVYYLHNEVDSIEDTAEKLAEIVPEARITVAHGQMRERELERIMSDFYHQRFNVLVCTTIIETGIDVPTANTIIMDRADKLGLAQLHQLRGRVGRSHHQAYAYLLTPHPKRLTKDAKKRLEAIENLEGLGAGFMLATHDLEIRGAGELLGEDQSGQMASVGFSLYMEMLDQAVAALKEGKEPSLDQILQTHTEVDLRVPALLPDTYIPDVNMRLSLYKRVATCRDMDALKDLQIELIDRFGLLPDAAKNLITIAEIKVAAQPIGINKIEMSKQGGYFEFSEATKVNPAFIIKLIQTQPQVYKLEGSNKLKLNIKADDTKERIKLVKTIIEDLSKQLIG
jgi:transcription-repair coupling factor (superfamily II helicase)